MSEAQPIELSSRELDLLNKIEELRGRLLHDHGIRAQISQRAYELYERRGGEPGRDVEDWVQAENEILSPLIEEAMGRTATAAQPQKSRAARISRPAAGQETSEPRKATKPDAAKESPSKSTETGPKVPKPKSKEVAPRRKGKGKVESNPDKEAINPSGREP